MSLPSNITTCRLEGTYRDFEGEPEVGHVIITPSHTLVSAVNNVVIVKGPITIPLDENGYFSIDLPVTNDVDVLPQDFTYEIREMTPGGRPAFNFLLPAGNATFDVSSFAPLPVVVPPPNTELEARVQALENEPKFTVGLLYPSAPRVGDVHYIPNW